MIEGLKTYGSDKLVKELPNLKNPIFICTIATTETSRIPGLTGAGATPELTKYTPAGDAELILGLQPGFRVRCYKNFHIFLGPSIATDCIGVHLGIGI